MFLFLRLLLAHFIADFPLQTDEIYRLKAKGSLGRLFHVLVLFIVSVIFAGPFIHLPAMWALLAYIAGTHYIIDATKLNWQGSFKEKSVFPGFILDQVLHTAVYLPCLFTNLKYIRGYVSSPKLWASFYNDNFLILSAIFFIAAVFSAIYFIDTLKISYFPGLVIKDPPRSYVYYGMAERFCIFCVAFLSGFCLFLIPVFIAIRFVTAKIFIKDARLKSVFLSAVDLLAGPLLAILSGAALRGVDFICR